jgi:LysR family transcriptional regulator (chromosome initiation inhibitor)
MLDYRLIEALSAVAEEKSFQQAARRLSITQSAVSQRIRALERAVGQPLLVRAHPPRLTELGRTFYRHYVQVRSLESTLQGVRGDALPQLRIAIDRDSLANWFADVATEFLAKTDALLQLIPAHEDATFRYLADGSACACVTSRAAALTGATSHSLGTAVYVCVATPGIREAMIGRNRRVSRAGLRRIPIITYDPADHLHTQLLKSLGFGSETSMHVIPNHHVFLAMLFAGRGYALLPLQEARPHIERGALVELRPGRRVGVPLYWQTWELQTPPLVRLTEMTIRRARRFFGEGSRASR